MRTSVCRNTGENLAKLYMFEPQSDSVEECVVNQNHRLADLSEW